MATYKKYRGSKKDIEKNEAEKVFNRLDEGAKQSEHFFEKNKKVIWGIIYGAVAVLLLIFVYQKWIKEPSEKESAAELAFAQEALEKDSLQLALDGDHANLGLIRIAQDFSSTPTGNIAKYLAGSAYYRLGQYDKAIEYLKKFKSDNDPINAEALGIIGDCYAQQDNTREALGYYEKAASAAKNDLTAPFYLMKAGNISVLSGDYSRALKNYESIKKNYPESAQAASIDKYIEMAKAAR